MFENKNITKILKERTKQLSEVFVDKREGNECYIDGLLFNLSEEKYAIESKYISEVIYIKDITSLPSTPDFLLGIINIRGKIFSVIDIRKFFGLPNKGLTNLNKVIVLKYEDIEFGILVDEIIGNKNINIQTLQKNITSVTDIPESFIQGISHSDIIVLDIIMLLKNDKIIINEIA